MPVDARFGELRALVLGFGSIGQRHTRNLRAAGVTEITVFDPAETRIGEAREVFGIEGSTDLSSSWKLRPDVVFVTSPTAHHVVHAMEAAERGCHVFVEKPMSHTNSGLAELAQAVEARSLVSMVGCNMRFHPGPETVKRLLDGGAIGTVQAGRVYTGSYLPAWRPGQDHRGSYSASLESGGAILDCIHEIDLTLWYLGPGRLAFAAVRPATSIGVEADGLAELIIDHDSGPLTSVHLNFIERDYRRGCVFVGDRGTVAWEFSEKAVTVFGADGQVRERFLEPAGWQVNRMYEAELAHFLGAVVRGEPAVNPVREAVRTTELALEARRFRTEARS